MVAAAPVCPNLLGSALRVVAAGLTAPWQVVFSGLLRSRH